MYAILDIEATGGNSKIGRITEVAIYKYDGRQIIDEFSSLVNPERKIPPYVQKLTGINNQMASEAPKFFEVAKSIVEITQDCCIVAHNVKFDYSFLQAEFGALGYQFKRERLCTLQLSRDLLPGLPSYSLGRLCQSLEIDLNSHHRAGSDARATVDLFKRLLEVDPHQVNRFKRKP